MSNSIKKPAKMTQKYICLCQAVSPVLRLAKWVAILPIEPSANKLNHLNTGCTFNVSKFWFGISICLQFFFGVYIAVTTIVRVHLGPPNLSNRFDWYLMTIGYMTVEADGLVSIMGGAIHAPTIMKILEKLSLLDGSLAEMRIISRTLQRIITILLSCYLINLISFFYSAWTRRLLYSTITFQNILESSLGVLIRGFICIFSQIQCAVVIMMCITISSKFQHLADSVKSTLEHACSYPINNENKTAKKNQSSNVKWMTVEHNATNITHLEHISIQHQEANQCLSEINHCFGLQLLVTFTSILFIVVYYLYRCITASDDNFIDDQQQRIHCSLSLVYLFIKMFLYLHVGQKVRKMAREPAREIQRAKLLSLPISFQQQIHSLILQWLSAEPYQLSALNIINVGPWLLAPIVGNVITYLLVAIQFKTNTNTAVDNTTYSDSI